MAEDDAKGTRIGGFEILERVGRGGMGTVFKARQVSMDRIVALKVLPPKRAKDDAYVQRFIREARSAARLTHNNIVQAIEVGRDGPYHFFAMEFVDGPTIRDLIEREGHLDERRALDIVKSVAHALERAHGEGIVHRDIKPGNIMIGSDGVVKLADLGLARSSENPDTLTVEGVALGTPYYMSPEQVRGEVELDTRADIYALGATLYHMVTGQAPFHAPYAGAIMAKHITDPIPSAHATCPAVSPACSQLIKYMLAKDREERPSTPADLLAAIDDALAGRVHLRRKRRRPKPMPRGHGTGLRLPTSVGEASLPRVRPRSLTAAWAFAGIGILILAVVLVWLASPGDQPPATQPRASTDATVVAERQRAEAAARKQREDAARQAWEQLATYARTTLTKNRAKRLLALADDFDAKHGKTELHGTVRGELTQLCTRARAAASQPSIPEPARAGDWVSLFDGKTLDGWSVIERFPGGPDWWGGDRGGKVRVADGRMVLEPGDPLTALSWTREFPSDDYEIALEAMRVAGNFACPVICFPVGTESCRFMAGGWANSVVGVGLVDGKSALRNITTRRMGTPSGLWYHVRLRVSKARIQAWLDDKEVVDLARDGHRFGTTQAWPADALTFCSFGRSSVITLRNIRLRRLGPEPAPSSVPELTDKPGDWVSLFDGKTLRGWRVADQGWFGRHGNAAVENGQIVLKAGDPMTGMATTREVPTDGYELSLEAMRVAGGGAFAGIVFPVGNSNCILEVGGKGGRVVGLGLVDGRDQDVNATTRRMDFELGRWYGVRLAVTRARIRAWIDDVELIDIERAGHRYTLWAGFAPLRPLGVHAWATTAALRNIRIRRVETEEHGGVGKTPRGATERLTPGRWQSLFDGKSLRGWRVEDRGSFNRHGKVTVGNGQITLDRGYPQTGVAWTGSFPSLDYEVEFEAKRVTGSADFASITFPVGHAHCTLHTGCWRKLVGLSKVDGRACGENETRREMAFQNGRWYRFSMRVTRGRIQCRIDDVEVVDIAHSGRKLSPEYGVLKPLGVCSWESTSVLRNIRFRRLGPQKREGVEEKPGRTEALEPG